LGLFCQAYTVSCHHWGLQRSLKVWHHLPGPSENSAPLAGWYCFGQRYQSGSGGKLKECTRDRRQLHV
jgi:hypothetical protein